MWTQYFKKGNSTKKTQKKDQKKKDKKQWNSILDIDRHCFKVNLDTWTKNQEVRICYNRKLKFINSHSKVPENLVRPPTPPPPPLEKKILDPRGYYNMMTTFLTLNQPENTGKMIIKYFFSDGSPYCRVNKQRKIE